jgi:hypothetical protein
VPFEDPKNDNDNIINCEYGQTFTKCIDGSWAREEPLPEVRYDYGDPPSPIDYSCDTPNSFLPGTMVLMADGSTKAIEDVKIGDRVAAADSVTGHIKAEPVTALIAGQGAKRLIRITVDTDGARGDATGAITATDNHPFWVPSAGAWVDAGRLQPGMWLQTSAGIHVQITAVKRWTARQRVHNLTVDELHTYHVLAGDQAVLVHNTNPDCDPLQDYADGVRNNPGVKFVSEYTSSSGRKYYGQNRHGQQVDGALANAVNDAGHHGGCAEVHCLIQAQNAEGPDAIRGGTMRTLQSRNSMSSNAGMHGLPGLPCGRCARLLDILSIN